MRRRIRLTGRRQLNKSAVKVMLSELGGDPLLVMTVVHGDAFSAFPADSRVSLRLAENKGVEIVDLGTIAKMQTTKKLKTRGFTAPSCQLRVADPGHRAKGLLLASTDNFTLHADSDKDEDNSLSILKFLPYDTAPQSWKLELKESDYPLVLVDKRIPNARLWARTDPVFLGTALPPIVRQIFDEILRGEYSDDTPWVVHWILWANTVLPGNAPPIGEPDRMTRQDYLDRLLDSFCAKHEFADALLNAATPEEEK